MLNKKKWNRGIPLILVGMVAILVFIFYDRVGFGKPGVGMLQLSGLIIGAIIAAAGLVRILFPYSIWLLRLLAGIYVTGILYFGLKPDPGNYSRLKVFMNSSRFFWCDAAINTVGFIPLGYLLMLSYRNRHKDRRVNLMTRVIIVAGVGVLISLFLETAQYCFIPGRLSSLYDWIFNSLGNLAGIALYILVDEYQTLRRNCSRMPSAFRDGVNDQPSSVS
jgi:glycopeptide antibiotics resistance protein